MTNGPGTPLALKLRLAAMPAGLRAGVNEALQRIGDATVEEARRLLEASGPRPSAPGSPPRDATGQLAATLSAQLDADRSSVAIASTRPYALDLEYGTRSVPARPFLRPAVEAVRPMALDMCRAALAQAAIDRGSGA